MQIIRTEIEDVLIIEPKVFGDDRGFFLESYNERAFAQVLGPQVRFVQDNHSRSQRGVLRGLHYQTTQTQGKLVRAVTGRVFDVAVDLRRSSRSFGRSVSLELSDENKRMLWIPPGFAHGFLVVSDTADFLYKTTDYYAPEAERTVLWNDADLAIPWPLAGEPVLSAKDMRGARLHNAEVFA